MCNPDLLKKLLAYFQRVTGILPEAMTSLDSTRLVILYFGISGFTLIGGKEDESRVRELIEWIYSHQITPTLKDETNRGGFRSVLYTAPNVNYSEGNQVQSSYDCSHVTMVYTALCTLLILGDDLTHIDRHSVLSGIAALHCDDIPGLYKAGLICPERDMRFLFSAVASCYILDGLDYLDHAAILSFIGESLTYEGGFGNLPGLEAHAGATYCALASLFLLGQLNSFLPMGSRAYEQLVKWLLSLQTEGFHGRPQKSDDTCYTFWVCASLKLLNAEMLVNQKCLLNFVSRSWDDVVGGIRKYPSVNMPPDPLHSYLALSGLACLQPYSSDDRLENGDHTYPVIKGSTRERVNQFRWLHLNRLEPIVPHLNIPIKAAERLKQIHRSWKSTI